MKKIIREVIKLESMIPGGQAMGQLADGRKVFVWGGLPNETVEVELTKLKKSYADGFVTDVIKSSPDRIEPRDECYLSTSPWQIMSKNRETEFKSQLVVDTFKQHHIDLPLVDIIGDGNFYNYRNKMEYSLWWDHDTNKIYPAFHRRGSHQKILIKNSSIERPEIWAECQRIVKQLNESNSQARWYQSLLIRANQTGRVSSALFEMNKPHPQMDNLTDTIMGQSYSYSPNGFFQINLPVYELALTDMKRFIADANTVVDMYSGVGTIGLSIARDKKLSLIETDKHAFAELQQNLPPNCPCITAVHAKSEDALEYITSDATIIVDPPRAGLDKKVIDRLFSVIPPQILYLSCNPATQARDVAMLLSKYEITHNQPFNFFPRTPHIENLIVLTRR